MKLNRLIYVLCGNRYIQTVLGLGIPISLWLFFYLPYLRFYLLHIDTAVYLLAGQMILNGAVPFLNFWDNKPPLIYYLYALILNISGRHNFIAVTYVTLLFNCVSTVILYMLIKKYFSRVSAFLTALLFPIVSYLLLFRDAINPNAEIYMMTFELTALFIGLRAIFGQKVLLMFFAGVSIGIATAFKQPGGGDSDCSYCRLGSLLS